ncbi:MAG: tyrosine-type recombinase/integrase [Acidimicrobiales bacterium]
MKLPDRRGWRGQISLPGGRRLSKQLSTKRAAEEWVVEQLQRLRTGRLATRKSMTLDEWMTKWRSLRVRSFSTMEIERIHYGRYFSTLANTSIDKLTPMVLRHFFESLEARFKTENPPTGRPHTVRLCHSLLRTSLGDAVEAGVLGVNPMHSVKRPKIPRPEPKYLVVDDVKKLVALVDESGEIGGLAVHLMLRLGLRRGEALGLLWGDVNFETGEIRIQQQLQRIPSPDFPGGTHLDRVALKTQGSVRTLVADDALLERLKSLRESEMTPSAPDDFVVAQFDGSPIDPSNFTGWLAKVGRSIGIHVSPHRLRHTAATLMLNQSVPLSTIGAVLGHTDARTTLIYARVTKDTKSAALITLGSYLDSL